MSMYAVVDTVVTVLRESYDESEHPDVGIYNILERKKWRAEEENLVLLQPVDNMTVTSRGPSGKEKEGLVSVDVRTKADDPDEGVSEALEEFRDILSEIEDVFDTHRIPCADDFENLDSIDVQKLDYDEWRDLSDRGRLLFRAVMDVNAEVFFETYDVK